MPLTKIPSSTTGVTSWDRLTPRARIARISESPDILPMATSTPKRKAIGTA